MGVIAGDHRMTREDRWEYLEKYYEGVIRGQIESIGRLEKERGLYYRIHDYVLDKMRVPLYEDGDAD